jgi:hypothetical protein
LQFWSNPGASSQLTDEGVVEIAESEVVVTAQPRRTSSALAGRRSNFGSLADAWGFLQVWLGESLGFTPVGRGFGAVSASASCVLCLEAGTEVQTPDGLKAIETLAVGDLVIAYDEATGQTAPKPISALIRPLPKAVMDVEIAGANGAVERVGVTADHPWFVVRGEGALEWVQTPDLKPGDHLVTADGRGGAVYSATLRDGFVQTYNLEVADFHTFLVGKHGVVVHNAKWCKGTFNTLVESLQYHFDKHGAEVGSRDVGHYQRQAEAFSQKLRGAQRHNLPGGSTRYVKGGKFIILDGNGNIRSFGRAR